MGLAGQDVDEEGAALMPRGGGDGRSRGHRPLFLGAILLLVAPAILSGLTYSGDAPNGNVTDAENVTLVGVQGPFGPTGNGRILAIDTETGRSVWEYANDSAGENVLYYDVDPLGDGELLFVQETPAGDGTALVVNWRTDEVVERFPVPSDTHDVDHLGGTRYVVADKYNHRAYVYDAATGETVWEYNFSNHFPEYPAAGDAPSTQPSGPGGYTHLNDVDAVDNGSAFLLSPRNFNRVVLVNRSTKATEWTLGEQNDTSILDKQHNPTLLSQDPPVVLVADSENDRVVEYRRENDSWVRTWEYRGDLLWPRDADRLPNGNTLIVDTRGQRVLEVTPDREIVWERRVTTMPYDIERLRYGDEPSGPPIQSVTGAADSGDTSVLRDFYTLSLWVVPAWVSMAEFYALVAAALVGLGWIALEVAAAVRRRRAGG